MGARTCPFYKKMWYTHKKTAQHIVPFFLYIFVLFHKLPFYQVRRKQLQIGGGGGAHIIFFTDWGGHT